MIDTHCHLEQPVYDKDRDEIIELCKSELKAVITCAPDPKDYELTFDLIDRHPNFVFAVAGIHPEYVKRFDDEEIKEVMKTLEQNKDKLVGIGETGLDYDYIKEPEWRVKQQKMFAKFIRFANRLDMPAIIHLRTGPDRETADVFADAFEILERESGRRVQLHMFGSRKLVQRAVDNGWYISMNAIALRSKSYGKVVRDTPIDRLMLETDAPWLDPSFDRKERNTPIKVRAVAERVAEIKKITVREVADATTKNAIEFFRLKL